MTASSQNTYTLARLPTEQRNPRTTGIDTADSLQVLRMLNGEDAGVATAVAAVLPQLAEVVDVAVDRVRRGGTVHYFGAGTSGRLAVLDAAELGPTFNLTATTVVAHHAGGTAALVAAVEGVEDSEADGAAAAAGLTAADVAIGLTASGRTPFVAAALRTARAAGAATVLFTSHPGSPIAATGDLVVAPDTGPEAVAGSTRLKAGTAQKFMLNGFSTALMVRLGRTYSNLMVDVVASNEKLRHRVVSILVAATGAEPAAARAALEDADGELKTAIVTLLDGTTPAQARRALRAADGVVARALTRS